MQYIYYEVFPEDLALLQFEIMARQTEEALLQIRIASNPHIQDPAVQREFVDQLMMQRRYLRGIEDKDELDRGALNALKKTLKDESRSGIAVK